LPERERVTGEDASRARRPRPRQVLYPDNLLPPFSSQEELDQIGDSVSTLAPGRPPITSPAFCYPGYMIFSGPGELEGLRTPGGRVLGAAIIRTVP